MTATDETLVLRPAETPQALAQGAEGARSSGRAPALPARAEGIELLGDLHGSGYEAGAALVRRADGQVVQLGTLLYGLLESIDGRRSIAELADVMCERLGRPCDEEHVAALAQKLAQQGLLAGHEHNAPPRRNPLLALRWKVLVTDPKWTSRLTAPFTFLYRPFILWPVVAGFVGVCWFVLFHKGIASATRDAMNKPALLVLVFALALLSAGFHELGHAAATRYGGATPGGMGVGLYLVWPAFYTDVTDAYRLPRRDRLRVDFGGLYFNAIVSVVTLGVWELWRHDALLLLVGLQLLMMVKNISPVIRSDGYHILADATGVPDLYAHIGPTLRRLIPWRRREPSALTGRARLLVTLWVLIVTPVLIAMLLGAVLLLPRLVSTAWDSGHVIASRIPHQGAIGVFASLLQLFALSLPAVGSILVTQRIVRGALAKGWFWSDGRPLRRGLVVAAAAGVACTAGWAWWPSGQYQAIQPYEHGTLIGFFQTPTTVARPVDPVRVALAPGRHLAVAMIPVGGATKTHPAFFFVPGQDGRPGIGILDVNGHSRAFPFQLPSAPGPGDTQALAVNTTDGTVVYKVAYAVITVQDGAPVTNTNGAYALADCNACAAVAVSFQVVLVVGTSRNIAPIDAAAAVNYDCPACLTVALANQIVVTLNSQPTDELVQKLQAALKQLDETSSLTSASAITNLVQQVQKQIDSVLQQSGQVATTPTQTTTNATTTTQTAPATTAATTTTTRSTTTAPAATTTTATTTEQTTTTATTTAATTTDTTPTTTTTP
jgi:putative peptide zinc metalloprotease protein